MNKIMPAAPNLTVEAFKKARQRPAVTKLEIAKLRSSAPNLPILAFEGDDDKIVYYHWISRIRAGLEYVSLPCRGKSKVLQLREILKRDLTGLSDGIYFFVDRDFDELRGQEPGPDIFSTDFYSVENYLVCETVLEKILEIEFHCHSAPAIRATILSIFKKDYDRFLGLTKSLNFRLYIARQKRLDVQIGSDKINDIAAVKLDDVSVGRLQDEKIIRLDIDLTDDDLSEFQEEFDLLVPSDRYRGKFALLFFEKWLSVLSMQNEMSDRGVFCGLDNGSAFRVSELGLNCFASRSDLPAELKPFVDSIQPPRAS